MCKGTQRDGKLKDREYKECYPSGSLTPSASVAIKAHKASKNYPARVITSHRGAPQEKLASLLNNVLKPLIQSSKYMCKNSFEFVKKAKDIKLPPGTKLFSYDAEALFPSIPIQECTNVIKQRLSNDPSLKNRTDLSPDDIADLINLCVESTDFVFDQRHHTTKAP